MNRWTSFILIFLGVGTMCFAQGSTLEAWLDISRDEAGLAVIKGMAKNESSKPLAYSYSLRLEKRAPSGNAINTQSGSFTLIEAEQKTLSSISINLGATSFFEVTLKVFDDEKVIAEKKIVSDEKFIAHFQQLKPQKKSKESPNPPKKEISKKNKNSVTDALEIEGLIIDDTRSKSGRDFYDQFYGKWVAPVGVTDFTITIRELPARGRAARVAIDVNGNTIIQRMLQPRQDVIELLAEQTVNAVKGYLQKNENLKKDMENGDQSGSGIF